MLEKIKPPLKKWKSDYNFKTFVNSIDSLGITILFALYNGFLAVNLLSIWNGSICIYYLFFMVIRGMVLMTERNNIKRNHKQKDKFRQRTFVISSIMLLVLNFVLIVPISIMVLFKKSVNMNRISAIAIATYTTYKIIMTSINFQKRKHSNNILVQELCIINFIDALVSILTLQNTMIMVMQDGEINDMFILSALSSAITLVVIIFISVANLSKALKRM